LIALATSADHPGLEPDSQLLLPALARRGIDARPVVWTEPGVEWSAFDAVVVRSTWDYFKRTEEWFAWLDRVEATGVPFLNPIDVVRWNSHKGYLSELASRGVPVVETLDAPRGVELDLARAIRERGWSDAIFKPAVAGAALGLVRVRGADEARDAQAALDRQLAEGDVLVQPFLPSIVEYGELSLLYFGGELSHTVIKRAKPGDIRVQPSHGGLPELVDPPAQAVATAEAVLDAVDAELLYARVDLVRGDDGTLRLIELEAIEPLLFIAQDRSAAARFADALAARLARAA
jgi:glutathione synthase/RimK-type ligase-like ATP-grasp enzyme